MINLPNPFDSAVAHPATVDEAVAAPVPNPGDATADPFDGPDIPLADLLSRGFDPEAFVNDCEPLPAFLSSPSQAYQVATEFPPVLAVLAKY